MLKEALRQGLVSSDPAAKVEALRDDCGAKGIFTKEEVRALFGLGALERLGQGNIVGYGANLLAATSGMRQGEILGLALKCVFADYILLGRQRRRTTARTHTVFGSPGR